MQKGVATAVSVDGYALGAFIGYLGLLLGIGAYSARFSSEGIGEFFVGGRKMNRLVVALSAVVSGRSAWLLLGVTGMAYATGASALWAVTGFWLVLFAWAGLGAALGPTTLLALYWKGTTRAGIFAGLVSGTVTTFVWYLTPALKDRLYELIPAFAVSLFATVVVSALTRPPADAAALMASMHHDDDLV